MTRTRFLQWLPWLIGCSLVVCIFIANVLAVVRGDLAAVALWRNDFTNFWAGGHFVDHRDYVGLYDARAFAQWQWARFGEFGPRFFSYPPTFFPLAQLLALVPYKAALISWLVVTGALFLCAVQRFWPTTGGGRPWLALLTPAGLLTLTMGQAGFLLAALWLGAFSMMDRKPVIAGFLIAGFLIKPQMAVLLPLVLILTGRWRVFAWAAGATLIFAFAILAAYGVAPWLAFVAQAVPRQSAFVHIAGDYGGTHTASTFTLVEFLAHSSLAGLAAHAVIGGAALYVLADAIRQRVSTNELALIAATATLLILPYAMSYDLIVPMVAAWRILADERADTTTKQLAALGFVGPQVTLIVHALTAVPILPLMLAALLAAQYRMVRLSGRVVPAAPQPRSPIAAA